VVSNRIAAELAGFAQLRACCGETGRERCRGSVAEGGVGPDLVVVGDPFGDEAAGMGRPEKQGLVEEFIPHAAVEARGGSGNLDSGMSGLSA
jgi:hypothetical protein